MKKLCVAKYWVSNMVQPVKYAAAVSGIASKGTRKLGASKQYIIHDLTEIGPHSAPQWPTRTTLSSMAPKNDAGYSFGLSRKRLHSKFYWTNVEAYGLLATQSRLKRSIK